MSSEYMNVPSIEGSPHSAEIVYRHDEDEKVSDFKVVVRPPIKVSQNFLEVYTGKDSFTEITEEVSTQDFTYFEMLVDYRAVEGGHTSPKNRIEAGVDVISSLIKQVNNISNGDIN